MNEEVEPQEFSSVDEAGAENNGRFADQPSVGDNGEADGAEPSSEDRLAVAEAKVAENLDGWQRAVAELANARKRFNQQTQLSYQNATVDIISKLLPIVDDFQRALDNAPETIASDSWFSGIELVPRKIQSMLDTLQIEAIPALGQEFDPNLHEALSSEPSEDYESGTVTRELLPGYRLGERVIRPTLVYVAA